MAFVTPSSVVGVSFVLAGSISLLGASLPAQPSLAILSYGARGAPVDTSSKKPSPSSPSPPSEKKANKDAQQPPGLVATLTAYTQVPHSWFSHFYLLSVVASVFWLAQYLQSGSLLTRLALAESTGTTRNSMVMAQVVLAWSLMFTQGSKRLYEHLFIAKPSKSTMWVVHWLLGLAFYMGTSVGVWIEGSEAILASWSNQATILNLDGIPIQKIIVGTAIFTYGWWQQHVCHKHLASLKKYSVPTEGLFAKLVCPHYTCECLIYLGMALAAAPPGLLFNKTVLSVLVFTVVSLGITAHGTKRWYESKFGTESMQGRWKMIPWVF